MSRSRIRRARIWLCAVTILIALVTSALPIYGMKLLYDEFPGVFSINIVANVLALPLASSVLLMMLAGWIGYGVLYEKRIPFWLTGIGLLAAGGIMADLSGSFHDFSHLLFDSCSGYGDWMASLGSVAAYSLAAIWLLEFRISRSSYFIIQRADIRITKS
jgi:hypothetical protein